MFTAFPALTMIDTQMNTATISATVFTTNLSSGTSPVSANGTAINPTAFSSSAGISAVRRFREVVKSK